MYEYNLGLRFQSISERYSTRPALKFSKDNIVSYAELNSLSNRLGRYLLDQGMTGGDVVCISGDKIVSTFACMIACLKLGITYSMVDPDSPVKRLQKIVHTCSPKGLFLGPDFKTRLGNIFREQDLRLMSNDMDSVLAGISHYDDSNLMQTEKSLGATPAYIMYTSGSTGVPKGAVMTHANVLNLIHWSIETFDFTTEDVLTNVNPLYFDNSVFDFYSSLFSGASLAPFPKKIVTNPKSLVDLIDELGCTSWFSVPTLLLFLQTMKALRKDNMLTLRRYIFGGEGYPKSKLKQLYDLYSDRAGLFNVYGPTECTCICSVYQISDSDFDDLPGFPPLGAMIKNFSYLILNDDEPVVDGQTGELCLLGPNVGLGYFNEPQRTKTVFVQNPLHKKYDEIMYRTGDLVKYNPDDDKIYILGRKDNQIKHMGYRIELEEIETALSCLESVSQAAVLHSQMNGLSQIVALTSLKTKIAESEIRNQLRDIIPDYMIPTKFHFMERLPTNANGKIDRVKLSNTYL